LFEMTESYDAAILGFVALPVICGFAAMAAVPPAKRAQERLREEAGDPPPT